MGFLKRILSIGRNKKSRSKQPAQVIPTTTTVAEEPSDEVAMAQLLRASSLNFSVLAEREFRSLSPTGHPFDQVQSSRPPVTPVRRNTYTVTIHRRVTLSTTEFPNANGAERDSDADPTVAMTPSDAQRLRKLRQDPSVASLLNIYDNEGAPDPTAFANSPRPNAPKTPTRQRPRSMLSKTPRSIGRSLRSIFGSVKTSRTADVMSTTSPSSQLEHPQTPGRVSRPRVSDSLDDTFATHPADESIDVTGLACVSTQAEAGSMSMDQTDIISILGPVRTPSHRASQVFRFLKDPKELAPLPALPVETESTTAYSTTAYSPTVSPTASRTGSLQSRRTGSMQSRHQVLPEFFLSEKAAPAPRGPRTRASPFPMKSNATLTNEDAADLTIDKAQDISKEVVATLSPTSAPVRPSRNPSRMSHNNSAASSSTNLPLPDTARPNRNTAQYKASRSTSSLTSQVSNQPYREQEGSPTMRSKYAQRVYRQKQAHDQKPLFNDENVPPQGNVTVTRKDSRKLRKRIDDAPFVDVFNSVPLTPVSQRVQHLTAEASAKPEKPSPASSSELSPETKHIMEKLRTSRRHVHQLHQQAAGRRSARGRGALR